MNDQVFTCETLNKKGVGGVPLEMSKWLHAAKNVTGSFNHHKRWGSVLLLLGEVEMSPYNFIMFDTAR